MRLFTQASSETFRLTRYFSITSLFGLLVVLGVLLFFYRYFSILALEQQATQNNVAITRLFVNTLWPNYAAYVNGTSIIPTTEIPHQPEVAQIREDVLRLMKGLNVVKVKIYNLDGVTVFSTEPKQIGEDRSMNEGFLTAKGGGKYFGPGIAMRFKAIY